MQTKLKKVLSLILSFAFVLSMASLPASVQALDPVTLSASTVTGAENQEVTVSIDITANSGVGAAGIYLKYDTTKLEYVTYADGPASVGALASFNENYLPDGTDVKTINYSFIHGTGVLAGGSLVDITFKILPGWSGSTPLNLSVGDFKEATSPYPNITPTITIGQVTSTGPATPAGVALTVANGSGEAGDDVIIAVDISANSGLAAADLFLEFDNTKLTYKSAVAGTATTGGISSIHPQPPVGDSTTIRQGFAIEGGISAAGSMMIVTFTIKTGWLGTTPLKLTVGDFTNDAYNPMQPAITNGTIASLGTYTISFDSDGGSAVDSITQKEGTAVTEPAEPTKVGFTFDGWEPGVPSVMPAEDVECQAMWTPNSYTITWNADNGTANTTTTVAHGVIPTAPSVAKTGYTFDKWDPTIVAATGDTTYTAQWLVSDYTITFDSRGGSAVATISAAYNASVAKPADPTRPGFTFVGWFYDDPVGEIEITWPYTITENVTFFAKWTALPTSTITFNTDGGSPVTPLTGEISSPVTPPADPTKENYSFAGWDPAIPSTFPADDIEITALWDLHVVVQAGNDSGVAGNVVNIPVNISGDSGLAATDLYLEFDNTKLAYNNDAVAGAVTAGGYTSIGVSTVGNLTKIHLAFAIHDGITVAGSLLDVPFTILSGWSGVTPLTLTTEDFFNDTYFYIPHDLINGEVSCTAIVNPTSTITFDLNGGDSAAIAPITLDEGATVTAPANPSRAGYTFIGWEPGVPPTMPVDDVNCVAQWEAIVNPTSTITFDLNGGDSAAIAPITLDEGATVTAPANPSRTGYTFTGWLPGVPPTMPVDDVNCVAQWEAIVNPTSTITFDLNGGDSAAIAPITLDEGATVTAPANPSRTGYTFIGWEPGVPPTMPVDDVNCVAQWIAAGVTLIVGSGSGIVGDDVVIAVDISGNSGLAAADLFLAFDNTKLTFKSAVAGTATAGGISSINLQPAVGDSTTIKQGFAIDGGISAAGSMMIVTFTIKSGWTGATPLELTTGDFVDDTYEYIPHEITNGEVSCTSVPIYTITWDADNGTAPTTTSVVSGDLPTAPTVAKTGYTFDKWDPTIVVATGDATYTALWTRNNYTITWNADNGTANTTTTVAYGVLPVGPTVTKTGYTFDKWDPTIVAATGDATYTALWTPNNYTITWNADNGTANTTTTVAYGVLPVGPTVTKTGYTFNKWDPTIVVATGDATYTAQWTQNPTSTITFDSVGGSAVAPITQEEGTAVTAPTNPTKEGYTFIGWLPGVPPTMPVDDVNCVAQWEENPVVITYTITFDADGGLGGEVQMVIEGVVPTAPIVTKEGYTFVEWTPEIVAATQNATYTAVWEEIIPEATSTITFCTLGGSAIAPITGIIGSAVTAPADPTMEGYVFVGWLPCLPKTFPEKDLTVVAVWRQANSTITFITLGGSKIDPITGEVGSAVTMPADPTKEGYIFKGWLPCVPKNFPLINIVVVAIWEEVKVDADKDEDTDEIPHTGSVLTGIAAFAAFSMAAAAAFVMKKKED